jgi:hypothetical protein
MRVRLTRKFADCIDGVDLSHRAVGEVIDLPLGDAILLIAEEWAVLERSHFDLGGKAPRRLRPKNILRILES